MKPRLNDIPDDVLRLLGELVDGALGAEDLQRLRKRLAEDSDALETYVKWMHLHALLSQDFQYSGNFTFSPPVASVNTFSRTPNGDRTDSGRRRWRLGVFAAAVAATLMLVFLPWALRRPVDVAQHDAPKPQERATHRVSADDFNRMSADSVAVLTNVANAAGSGIAGLTVGSPVRSGRFELDSGLVQLEFLSGANVVVEGPATLELRSTKLVVCDRGKLRVRVPQQAIGFVVETPRHRAVDMGTEFAVSVGDGDATEVHVFQGEVELFDLEQFKRNNKSAIPETLRIGTGLRATGRGLEERIAADSEKFVDVDRMLQILSQQGRARYTAWQQQSRRWQSDPHAIVYYNFDGQKPSSRVLHNSSPLELPSLNGAIVGCRWTEGRWPGKAALEFKGLEDRVRLDIPGEFRSITLSCWIRIDGFDRRLGSLFLTDGHELGEPHWQFTNGGQLLLGVEALPAQSQEYLSGSVLKPTDLGRWIHIACTYDDDGLEVSHYIDGERVYSFPITKRIPVRFGPVELGNWVPEDLENDRIRNLNGRVDEFLLLDRSMTGDEIKQLYVAGQPNS